MFRKAVCALIALTAAACATTKAPVVKITSEPEGALVTVAGYGECETPCTVALDSPRQVVVAKVGYKPRRFTLSPDRKRVHVVLDLAAPTKEVESDELPEIE
jgi:hypothetical protein